MTKFFNKFKIYFIVAILIVTSFAVFTFGYYNQDQANIRKKSTKDLHDSLGYVNTGIGSLSKSDPESKSFTTMGIKNICPYHSEESSSSELSETIPTFIDDKLSNRKLYNNSEECDKAIKKAMEIGKLIRQTKE